METFVLDHLDWRLNIVTPTLMITYMLSQFNLPKTVVTYIYYLAHHCAENLQAEYLFTSYYASEIAMASIYWAIRMSDLPDTIFFDGLYIIKGILCTERFHRAEECYKRMIEDTSQCHNLIQELSYGPETEIVLLS
jgi:hypothetical protein